MITKEKKNYKIYLQSKEDSLVKTKTKGDNGSSLAEETKKSETNKEKKKNEKKLNQSDSPKQIKKTEKKIEQSKIVENEIPNKVEEKTVTNNKIQSLATYSKYAFKDTIGNIGSDSAILSNCIAPSNKNENSVIQFQKADTFPLFGEFIIKNKEIIFKEKLIKQNNKIVYTNSIFYPHVLKTKHPHPIYIHRKENGVGFMVLFLALLLFAVVQVLYHKRFQMFKNAFFNNRYAAQIMREENVLNYRISLLLTGVFLLTGSLFIFQINKFYNSMFNGLEDWKQFGIILFSFSSYFAAKYIINKILGYIFMVEKEIKEYLFNYFLFNQFWGLSSIIILAFMEYGRDFPVSQIMAIGLISYALVFVYQIIRSYSLAMPNKRISNLYLFLYFCTLEILPLVIISSFLF
jgi:hypothetical protein